MAVDRNVVSKVQKVGKVMLKISKRLDMNRSTVWKTVKKLKETENTLDRPARGRKRSVRSPQRLKHTRERVRRNPRRSCRTLATAAGVSISSMH